ncbi:MAG: hypothetical protein KJ955_07010 [Nanoarchaeota archaeon]|nr:hypothetical protein [Nanoarchaeota archaeon]
MKKRGNKHASHIGLLKAPHNKQHIIMDDLRQLFTDIKKSIAHALKHTFNKYIKKLFLFAIESAKKYINLLAMWAKLKNIDEISKKHFEIGRSRLETARKEAEKRLGKKIVREFDTIAEEKAEKFQARPKESFKARVFVMQRIKENVLELLHPLKLIKQAKKTKEMAYTNGWAEKNSKRKVRK